MVEGRFFLFQAVIGYISSNHGVCHIKKTRAQVPTVSSIERLECLVDLRYLWTLFAMKRWLLAAKMYYICRAKISMHLSRYEKKPFLLL